MKIIKTAVTGKSIRLVIAAGVVLITPAIALVAAAAIPDAISYMTEAAKYSVYPLESISEVNNGSLILYTPSEIPDETEYAEKVEAEKKEALFLSQNISDTEEDLSLFNVNSGDIEEITYSPAGGPQIINLEGGGQVRNCTELDTDMLMKESKIKPELDIELFSSEPQVLIMHTHTNESYELTGRTHYDESYTSRSADPDNSVVAVGTALAEELAAAGIAVLHDGTVHDAQYNGAYVRSCETTRKLLEQFPSIKIVLDIHRDAIEEEDGTRISAVTEIDGRKAAQIMIISAADDGNYDNPDYIKNFRFACAFQQSMESHYPTLTRPVLFKYCQYNQHLSPGSLLIEVGSHGNSIDQAVYSGRLIGRSLAAMYSDGICEQPVYYSTVPRFFIDKLR